MIMKVALLGTGFGQAHAAVYAQRSDVDEVVVFGRTSEKLAQIGDDFGFATSTDLDAVLNDSSVDLVDICLPTRLHADVAVRALIAACRAQGQRLGCTPYFSIMKRQKSGTALSGWAFN
jgi:UDP-N-acetylglucosamine 3-dehydrogenase